MPNLMAEFLAEVMVDDHVTRRDGSHREWRHLPHPRFWTWIRPDLRTSLGFDDEDGNMIDG